eukprot:SAG31_NODE_2204_length_6198_cov_3.698967_5_plen_204_part_00
MECRAQVTPRAAAKPQAAPAKGVTSAGSYYGNPFVGSCRASNESCASEANVTVRQQVGAICAPGCGCATTKPGTPDCTEGFVECPAALPVGTTATPLCMFGVLDPSTPVRAFKPPAYCALVCDPSGGNFSMYLPGVGFTTSKYPYSQVFAYITFIKFNIVSVIPGVHPLPSVSLPFSKFFEVQVSPGDRFYKTTNKSIVLNLH